MVSDRTRRPLLVVLLFGLLFVGQLQFGLAIIGNFWWSILSWDNPATHAFEHSASCTPPYVDPARQARGCIIAAAITPSGSGLLGEWPACADQHTLSSRIIRSPPAA